MVLRRATVVVVVFAMSLGLSWALIDLTGAEAPQPVPSIVLRDDPDDDDPNDDDPPGDGQTRTRTRTRGGGAATASPPPPPPAGGGSPPPVGDDTFETATDGTD